jgi:YfiH family protein
MPWGVGWGFTTRQGGVSNGPWGSLTLARAAGVPDAEIEENWARVLGTLDPRLGPTDVALASQVHGSRVVVVDAPTGPLGTVGEADALVTTARGVALAVRVADCVPVLLGSPRGVAAVHAGWRGVAQRVVPEALRVLLEESGSRPGDVCAAVGPHISTDAFEVGPEVVEGIAASGIAPELFARRRGDRWVVDLGAAVEAQLRGLGVSSVYQAGACTTGPRFFSWRANGPETGRQAGVIVRFP